MAIVDERKQKFFRTLAVYVLVLTFSASFGTKMSSAGTAISEDSTANASGYESTAVGDYANASGAYATANGYSAQATADNSTADGSMAVASGIRSTAVGNNATYRLYPAQIPLTRITTVHQLQDTVITRLYRQMYMMTQSRISCHDMQNVIAHIVGMRCRKTDTHAITRSFGYKTQQCRKVGRFTLGRYIAIRIDILSQ